MNMVPDTIKRKAAKSVLKTKQNSPHIFFGLGLGSIVVGTILACRATLKLEKELDAFKAELETINVEDGKSAARIYAKHAYILGKMYAPAVLVSGAGIGLLTKSHFQLTKRNRALTAAYAGLLQAFNEYRVRVRSVLGVDEELRLYTNAEVEKVKHDGRTVEDLKINPTTLGEFVRIFDESNIHFKKDAEWNMVFLRHNQEYFNHLLRVRHHVFLNEVLEELGFEHTQEGAIVGWVIDDDTPNYIDFGFFTGNANRFVNGDERAVILDFNVNGVIWDKVGK